MYRATRREIGGAKTVFFSQGYLPQRGIIAFTILFFLNGI